MRNNFIPKMLQRITYAKEDKDEEDGVADPGI